MKNLFFTADLHFFHKKMLGLRQFESLEAMHDRIAEDWNAQVGKDDHVWVLGDISFGRSDATVQELRRLNGYKHLVRGNHDKNLKPEVLETFVTVQDYKFLKVPYEVNKGLTGVYEVALSHFPMLVWDKAHVGSLHFHGHSHGNLKFPDAEARIFDVGVDSTGQAVIKFDEVLRRMDALGRKGRSKIFDHHEEQ